jgi:hypothetical protein
MPIPNNLCDREMAKFREINSALTGSAVVNYDPQTGAPVLISPGGAMNTAEIVRLVGGNFIAGEPLLSHIWDENLINGGTTTTTDGELVLETNTTANGEVRVQSFRRARFITATFNLSHQAVATPDKDNADVIRRWGVYNPDDASKNGIYFENSSGSINIVRIKNDVVAETVALADFNGQDAFVFDDNVHIYEIIYNAGTMFFQQDRKLIHKMQSLDAAAFGTPHLRVGHLVQNINSNTTNNSMITRGSSISRIGAHTAVPDFFTITAVGTFTIKNTPGRLHKINIVDKGIGSSMITAYNSTTGAGEIITTIDSSDVTGSIPFDVEFDTGLTIVTTGGNTGLTVTYD